MSDKPWKAFERDMGKLFGGARYWANSGEAIDCEGPTVVAQCKHVKSLSLNALAELAETVEKQGERKFKAGVVAVRTRPGAGRKATTLVVMTDATWRMLHGARAEGARAEEL